MTSVPPTQPPAAPETDVRLREALHRAFHDHWGGPNEPLDLYADSPLWEKQVEAVERIVAERVRVVEGERDAAMAETEISGQMRHITAEMVRGDQTLDEKEEMIADLRARVSHAEAERDEQIAKVLRLDGQYQELLALSQADVARAEAAEAAHRALQAAVEALADEYARRQARNAAHNGNVSCSVWGIAGAEVGRLAGGAR